MQLIDRQPTLSGLVQNDIGGGQHDNRVRARHHERRICVDIQRDHFCVDIERGHVGVDIERGRVGVDERARHVDERECDEHEWVNDRWRRPVLHDADDDRRPCRGEREDVR